MLRAGSPNTQAYGLCAAAPAGGARVAWCRGCVFGIITALMPCAVTAQTVLPSGQDVELTEILHDDAPGALWLRFRFVAPAISRSGGTLAPGQAFADMDTLCQALAPHYAAENDLEPERVVISLSDRVVPFGTSDPDATQFFELFSLRDGRCIWEEF